jgi:hypothetical protein
MGFIHHTTGAAGATGLMAESARLQGSTCFGHHGLPATDLPGLPNSADRTTVQGEMQPGRDATGPIPLYRFRVFERQHH